LSRFKVNQVKNKALKRLKNIPAGTEITYDYKERFYQSKTYL